MKGLAKILTVMAAVCMVAACAQTFEETVSKGQENAKGRLMMNVGETSRTIMPQLPSESDIASAVLTANDKEIGNWSGSNVIEQINSEQSILLDVGTYNFKMVFKDKTGEEIFIGKISNRAIAAGDNSLIFNMKLPTTGNGSIEIKLNWEKSDNITKVTAGLYGIAAGNTVYNDEQLKITDEIQAVYTKTNVPVGQYMIKFKVYNNEDLLNTLTDVVTVMKGKNTVAQKTLSDVNTLYTITYNLNGGNWKNGFTPVTVRNANTGILLPGYEDYENLTNTGYTTLWYTDEECTTEIESIPAGFANDITLYAKWTAITADNVAKIIAGLKSSGPHDIAVTGAITSETISAIKTALQNNKTAKVDLDLSQTTGLTAIGDNAFKGCRSLTSVSIPNSVTSIGSCAFTSCSSLTSVSIPTSVTSIDDNAFSSCSSLTSVSIPDSVTSISMGTFYNCTKLTSVIIPDSVTSIGSGAFKDCSSLTSLTIGNGVTSIGSQAFDNCRSLTSVIIGNGVTSISKYAFSGCSSLTSVIIPDSVTSIGGGAFFGCHSLTSVTIPNSVTSIGGGAFYNCRSLKYNEYDNANYLGNESNPYLVLIEKKATNITSCNINTATKVIADGAFSGCSSLTSVTIGNGVTSIGKSAFENCRSLTSVSIPDSVTYIDDYAFKDCSSLTSVSIPDSVTYIDDYAFKDCSSLTSVTIGNGVTSIGFYPFIGCDNIEKLVIGAGFNSPNRFDYLPIKCSKLTSLTVSDNHAKYKSYQNCIYTKDMKILIFVAGGLTSVTIPDSVTSIGGGAFKSCSSLISVTIPTSGVTSISNDAFVDCSSLEKLIVTGAITSETISAIKTILKRYTIGFDLSQTTGLTAIDNGVFKDCSKLTSVSIPNSVTSIGSNAFRSCSSLTSVTIPDSVTSIGRETFSGCSSLTSVTIPDSVTSIGYSAFSGCSSLTSVTIPTSVTSIGGETFSGCSSLTSVSIPDSVTSIGSNAFRSCSSLTSVTIPDSVTSIKKEAFSGCSSLTSMSIPNSVTSISEETFSGCSSLTSVTIGNGVTSIDSGAFSGCSSLTSVTIGNGVTYIGGGAFYGCSSLTSVIFKNTSGWYCGIWISVTDSAKNATYLKETYCNKTWERG